MGLRGGKKLTSVRIKRILSSFRHEVRVGSDNNPIIAGEEVSERRGPSFSDFDFSHQPEHEYQYGSDLEPQQSRSPPLIGEPPQHLRIKAQQTHSRLVSPHRSPPSRPYTSTSTESTTTDFELLEQRKSPSFESDATRIENAGAGDARQAGLQANDQSCGCEVGELVPENGFQIPHTGAGEDSAAASVAHVGNVSGDDSSSIYSEVLSIKYSPSSNPRSKLFSSKFSPGAVRSTSRQAILLAEMDYTDLVLPPRHPKHRPTRVDQNRVGRLSTHGSNANIQSSNPKIVPRLEARVPSFRLRAAKRASIASSLASMLPYILKYNSDFPNEAAQSIHDYSGEEPDVKSLHGSIKSNKVLPLSAAQQIQRILSQTADPLPTQPLNIRKKPKESALPCKIGVQDYASQLEAEFSQYDEVEPDPVFREKLLRGTTYSVRRGTRFVLDKDLPALPTSKGYKRSRKLQPITDIDIGKSTQPFESAGKQKSPFKRLCRKFKLNF